MLEYPKLQLFLVFTVFKLRQPRQVQMMFYGLTVRVSAADIDYRQLVSLSTTCNVIHVLNDVYLPSNSCPTFLPTLSPTPFLPMVSNSPLFQHASTANLYIANLHTFCQFATMPTANWSKIVKQWLSCIGTNICTMPL